MEVVKFSDAFLEELKHRNNIVSVVSKYVPLEKKGKTYWGRCPFHSEKTPSFSVNEIDQFYYCFGCKAGGNVIRFVMEMESVSFVDAVKMLAEWAGMELPSVSVDAEAYEKERQEKKRLIDCLRSAAKHYHENLKKSSIAMQYLSGREIYNDTIIKFGIGFSLDYQEIITYLKSQGFDIATQMKAGIVKEKDGRYYDALGERIIFPIINLSGDVVAFSGRTMKKQVDYAKYINTAETPVFSKSKNMFGINLVKKEKQKGQIDTIVIVEGQIDVIALHKAGFSTAVASLGTALTVDQARMLKRICNNVVLCYDGDTAGVKATLRGLDILKREGMNVRVASLPEKTDPDEYIKKYGTKAFQGVIDKSLPLIEFKLNYLKSQYNLKEFDGKARYVESALDVLSGLSEVEAEVYLDLIREATAINKDFLRKKLTQDRDMEISESNFNAVPQKREKVKTGVLKEAELCIIANALRNKPYAKRSEKILDILDESSAQFYAFILSKDPSVQGFIDEFQETFPDIVGAVVNYQFGEDEDYNKQCYDDCLWVIYRGHLAYRQTKLFEKLKVADGEEKRVIMQELYEITQQINNRRVDL